MATRTHATKATPAKKTTAKKATAKPPAKPTTRRNAPAAKARERGVQVDLRKPLPTRPRPVVGPLGATEQAAVRAALASAMLRLPIPVTAWHGPTAQLQDGTRITHTDVKPPAFNTPTDPPQFTAHVPCPYGAIHEHLVYSAADLTEARAVTRTCTTAHGTADQHHALIHGVRPHPEPKTPVVLQLREGIHRANSAAAETQPLSTSRIAVGLEARTAAAADEEPKEDPTHD